MKDSIVKDVMGSSLGPKNFKEALKQKMVSFAKQGKFKLTRKKSRRK